MDRTTRNLTKRDIMILCQHLQIEFKNILGKTYVFKPEWAVEGGVYIDNGKENFIEYKTVRFLRNRHWEGPSDIENWHNSDDVVVGANQKIDVFYKALNGATWKKSEISIIKRALEQYGFVRLSKRESRQ